MSDNKEQAYRELWEVFAPINEARKINEPGWETDFDSAIVWLEQKIANLASKRTKDQ